MRNANYLVCKSDFENHSHPRYLVLNLWKNQFKKIPTTVKVLFTKNAFSISCLFSSTRNSHHILISFLVKQSNYLCLCSPFSYTTIHNEKHIWTFKIGNTRTIKNINATIFNVAVSCDKYYLFKTRSKENILFFKIAWIFIVKISLLNEALLLKVTSHLFTHAFVFSTGLLIDWERKICKLDTIEIW